MHQKGGGGGLICSRLERRRVYETSLWGSLVNIRVCDYLELSSQEEFTMQNTDTALIADQDQEMIRQVQLAFRKKVKAAEAAYQRSIADSIKFDVPWDANPVSSVKPSE